MSKSKTLRRAVLAPSTKDPMSKGQRGNKEQKKAKKAHAPAPVIPATSAEKAAEAISVAPRKK